MTERFLDELFADGRLTVPAPDAAEDAERLWQSIQDFEPTYRLDLPGQPPGMNREAAVWAARLFLRAAQCLVYRELDESTVRHGLSEPCPAADDAAAHYSVDFTFRFLPDLIRFARAAAERDPLLDALLQWAARWPLSSVGVAGVQADARAVDAIAGDPCLLRMYVDRIIASSDEQRLTDPRVRDAVRAALGAHGELSPKIFERLF